MYYPPDWPANDASATGDLFSLPIFLVDHFLYLNENFLNVSSSAYRYLRILLLNISNFEFKLHSSQEALSHPPIPAPERIDVPGKLTSGLRSLLLSTKEARAAYAYSNDRVDVRTFFLKQCAFGAPNKEGELGEVQSRM
ncbi:hypothetical protein SASPL_155529 (mitochondrion) [Salvia splendens]|uniref:Uncharacterized protein n=1 Tax=Salvia splendens TaxID=180675 RepID=A0A8X8VYE6_SALSN|nr:hypothetical protein SASPL_156336 [Salvia splendens]KAG6384675.1 hypothetical protein SASPL_155529 [Salvia splendens]